MSNYFETKNSEAEDEFADHHHMNGLDTPMHSAAFDFSDKQKVDKIQKHFAEIMHLLGLDLDDDSLKNTPKRVAKMFVNEIFGGLNPDNKPAITTFDNKYSYRRLVIEKNIPLYSTCEHHFQPIIGIAHVAYIPKKKVVGLSKLNRIVDFYGRRPQVQERLNLQIAEELRHSLETDDVAVYIEAKHMCVEARGVKHHGCSTITAEYKGKFLNESTKAEFLAAIAK